MQLVSIPSCSKFCSACCPKMSVPTFATNVTAPPKRCAATAWLAPLPPALIKNVPPNTVSPGAGRCSVLMTISVLELPTITMEGFISKYRYEVLKKVAVDKEKCFLFINRHYNILNIRLWKHVHFEFFPAHFNAATGMDL